MLKTRTGKQPHPLCRAHGNILKMNPPQNPISYRPALSTHKDQVHSLWDTSSTALENEEKADGPLRTRLLKLHKTTAAGSLVDYGPAQSDKATAQSAFQLRSEVLLSLPRFWSTSYRRCLFYPKDFITKLRCNTAIASDH